MSSGEKGAVWTDQSTSSDGDEARVEEGAVTVNVDTFAESMRVSLRIGQSD
jgi:hypothetical protein